MRLHRRRPLACLRGGPGRGVFLPLTLLLPLPLLFLLLPLLLPLPLSLLQVANQKFADCMLQVGHAVGLGR